MINANNIHHLVHIWNTKPTMQMELPLLHTIVLKDNLHVLKFQHIYSVIIILLQKNANGLVINAKLILVQLLIIINLKTLVKIDNIIVFTIVKR